MADLDAVTPFNVACAVTVGEDDYDFMLDTDKDVAAAMFTVSNITIHPGGHEIVSDDATIAKIGEFIAPYAQSAGLVRRAHAAVARMNMDLATASQAEADAAA